MKEIKITPLTVRQYVDISDEIYDEVERVEHGGILAAKCSHHPKYGNIILISSNSGDCLMIHADPTTQL